jgi:DNA-directed RNA polymerase sigma subunit (sigma70/sigma32)
MATRNLSAGFTYEEIATLLGVSVVRVQQIERRALWKLRRGLARVGVHSFDGQELRASAEREAEH